MKTLIIAFGGNALIKDGQKGTIEEQFYNLKIPLAQIARLSRKYRIIITHGNGPQVGNLLMQQEVSRRRIPKMPLEILVAETQGQIGYMIQQSLRNLLGDDGREIATVVTQVLVDRDDPDFTDPHKPVGPFYTEEEASRLEEEKGWTVRKVKVITYKTHGIATHIQ